MILNFRSSARKFFFSVATAALVTLPLLGQDSCSLPPSPFAKEPNMFTPEQERDLGDAEAERVERQYHVIRDS